MERYKLVCSGALSPQAQGRSLEEIAQNLRLNSKVIQHLSEGKSVVFKKGQTLSQAQKLREQLSKKGLISQLKLELSPECFQEGLRLKANDLADEVSVGQAQQVQEAEQTLQAEETHSSQLPMLTLDSKFLTPTIISFPKTYSLPLDADESCVHFRSHYPSFGVLGLVLILLPTVVYTEMYLVRFLSEHLHWQRLATVVGIISLIAMALVMLRTLQPLNIISLSLNDRPGSVDVVDCMSFGLGCIRRQVYQDEKVVATLERKPKEATAYNLQGKRIYHCDFDDDVAEEGELGRERVYDQISDFSLEEIFEHFNMLKKGYRWFKRKTSREHEWDVQDAKPICDANGKIVALVYDQLLPAIEMKTPQASEDLLLYAFCLSILKPCQV